MRLTAIEERLVGGEPRVGQHRDLLAQVVLELRDVDGVDRLPAPEVAPPLVDLLLERHPVAVEPASSGSLRQGRGRRRVIRRGGQRRARARCLAASRPRPATADAPRRAESGPAT